MIRLTIEAPLRLRNTAFALFRQAVNDLGDASRITWESIPADEAVEELLTEGVPDA